jgi:hypothetical protein
MGIKLSVNETDDPEFIDLVSRVIDRSALIGQPHGIFVVKIDNWFDERWLNFSGKGRVGVSYGNLAVPDTVLDEFRQDKITFPPFNPRRVINERYFEREVDGGYQPSIAQPLVHRRRLERSANNLHQRVVDFTQSAIFVWFSSNTKQNQRGSIMLYESSESEVRTWFAAVVKKQVWEISQTKGIGVEVIRQFARSE